MGEHVTKMIWCEDCCREGWDQVITWSLDGRAVTRAGVLKIFAECRSCGDELLPGERAKAVALNMEESEMTAWMNEYLVYEEELKKGYVEKEEV